ncbi:type VI secretion system Vgr family protein [Cupriavidus sp. UME77]
MFGERHNTFVQDDTPGEIQTQIGSDHQASMLRSDRPSLTCGQKWQTNRL